MRCEQCREALSARLDGEEDPTERDAVDAHVAGCPSCERWAMRAAEVSRMVRLGVVTAPSPVDDVVLRALPGRGRRRLATALRVALGALGVAQFVLGMAQMSAVPGGVHDHAPSVASAAHLWNESAAWNVAIGAGFAWIAARRSRPSGLLPLLSVFVLLLLLVSANDLWLGGVETVRLLSHGLIVAGYLIVLILSRRDMDFGGPSSSDGARPRPGWRARFDPEPDDAPGQPPLRRLNPGAPPQIARTRRAA